MKRVLMFAILVLLAGCERVVDLQAPSGPRRLVVEARFELLGSSFGVQNAQTVKLSTTTGYFSDSAPPPASAAVVQVKDDLGRVNTLSETGVRGTYLAPTSFRIQRGRTYTLSVAFEGQQYSAVESTRDVPVIQSIYLDGPHPGRYSGVDGLRATIDYNDPIGTKNFYMWEQYVDGTLQLGPDSVTNTRVIATDQLTDGIQVRGFQPYEGIQVSAQSTVIVRQIGISEAAYQFFFALNDQVSANGSPFAVAPASLRGNIQNLTTPSMPALGYFYVSVVSDARFVPRVTTAGAP